MRVDVRTHLDLLDLDDLLLLARFGGFLLRRVFQFAQIKDLAHRRFRVRRDLDEVKTQFFRHAERLIGGNAAVVYTFGVDELHPGNPDFLVRAGPVFDRGVRFERSANGRTLLELLRMQCRMNSAKSRLECRSTAASTSCGNCCGKVNNTALHENHHLSGIRRICFRKKKQREALKNRENSMPLPMSNADPDMLEVGSGSEIAAHRHARPAGKERQYQARAGLAGWLPVGHDRHQGRGAGAARRNPRRGLHPF